MSDINQTIRDFYQTSQSRDFARDFQFRLLSITAGDASSVTFDESDLVYIRTSRLPGRDINNIPVPYMGLDFNVPGSVKYPGSDNFDLEFYCDAQSQIRQKFELWSRDTFDDATSTGNYLMPKPSAILDMVQLDNKLNAISGYKLVGVSVRKVGPLEYNIAEGKGDTVKFTASISYHYWERSKP